MMGIWKIIIITERGYGEYHGSKKKGGKVDEIEIEYPSYDEALAAFRTLNPGGSGVAEIIVAFDDDGNPLSYIRLPESRMKCAFLDEYVYEDEDDNGDEDEDRDDDEDD